MDPRVKELHCIMPLANIPSVLQQGILSHDRAAKLAHTSVAMAEIQDRRGQVSVPGGLRLHQYANLYFHARNPMLYRRLDQMSEICVLCVSTEVLRLPDVVLADCNASSEYVRFLPATDWRLLPFDDIYALDWNHPDRNEYYRRKSRKCAEVLVPQQVEPRYLEGARVVDAVAAKAFEEAGFTLPTLIDPVLFFR